MSNWVLTRRNFLVGAAALTTVPALTILPALEKPVELIKRVAIGSHISAVADGPLTNTLSSSQQVPGLYIDGKTLKEFSLEINLSRESYPADGFWSLGYGRSVPSLMDVSVDITGLADPNLMQFMYDSRPFQLDFISSDGFRHVSGSFLMTAFEINWSQSPDGAIYLEDYGSRDNR